MSGQRHWKWLTRKLPEWVAGGLLSQSQADAICAAEADLGHPNRVLARILIAISALLIALGVISFFAFSWHAMGKWPKLAVIFTALAGVHFTGYVFSRKAASRPWAEFCHLLGTLFFGAGIVLISQIYHIDEHFPHGVLLWSLGALAMAWALDSSPQMLCFAVLVVIWQAMERALGGYHPWALVFTAVCLAPFAGLKKYWFSTFIAAAAVVAAALIQMSYHAEALVGGVFLLGLACLGTGFWARRTVLGQAAKPLEMMGDVLYLGCLILFTFKDGLKFGLIAPGWGEDPMVVQSILVIIDLVLWAGFCLPLFTSRGRSTGTRTGHGLLALIGFLLGLVMAVTSHFGDLSATQTADLVLIGMIAFNALVFAHGLVWIIGGMRSGRVGVSFMGCLLVVFVILARFADYADDLLMRAVSFVLAGVFIMYIALKTSRGANPSDANETL